MSATHVVFSVSQDEDNLTPDGDQILTSSEEILTSFVAAEDDQEAVEIAKETLASTILKAFTPKQLMSLAQKTVNADPIGLNHAQTNALNEAIGDYLDDSCGFGYDAKRHATPFWLDVEDEGFQYFATYEELLAAAHATRKRLDIENGIVVSGMKGEEVADFLEHTAEAGTPTAAVMASNIMLVLDQKDHDKNKKTAEKTLAAFIQQGQEMLAKISG